MFCEFGTLGWPEIKLKCQGQILEGLDATVPSQRTTPCGRTNETISVNYQAGEFRLDSAGNGEALKLPYKGNTDLILA